MNHDDTASTTKEVLDRIYRIDWIEKEKENEAIYYLVDPVNPVELFFVVPIVVVNNSHAYKA